MKNVQIIGLSVNNDIGIIKAHELKFDKEKKLLVFKGSVGQGKTTEQKILQLGTQGSKSLTDKNLYGDINTETQLLDGDVNLWVGCRSLKGKLSYSLYTKDNNGNIILNPVIDGVKATPAKYLEALQTELTWNMDKLTSETSVVQRDILLKLYQHEFIRLGVIFDKKNPSYNNSILHKIDLAEEKRNQYDAKRKELGGIKEDLKNKGFDVERPETIPVFKDISEIDNKIKEIEKQITIKETEAKSSKENKLLKIKGEGVDLVNKCMAYNTELKSDYEKKLSLKNEAQEIEFNKKTYLGTAKESLLRLFELEAITKDFFDYVTKSIEEKVVINEINEIPKPNYIIIKDNKVESINPNEFEGEAKELVNKTLETKSLYMTIFDSPPEKINLDGYKEDIEHHEQTKLNYLEQNKIYNAAQSYYDWKKADDNVAELKREYVSMLADINTGVEGLKITVENDDIFLMYDGSYDPAYFSNENKELRKVSSYSGTQKPVICLLIQNYLLSRKAKAMRYMYIDNVPIDKKTIDLLENIGKELNLTVFLNITGDFDKETLKDGEILIEGGEVFFNNINK